MNEKASASFRNKMYKFHAITRVTFTKYLFPLLCEGSWSWAKIIQMKGSDKQCTLIYYMDYYFIYPRGLLDGQVDATLPLGVSVIEVGLSQS